MTDKKQQLTMAHSDATVTCKIKTRSLHLVAQQLFHHCSHVPQFACLRCPIRTYVGYHRANNHQRDATDGLYGARWVGVAKSGPTDGTQQIQSGRQRVNDSYRD